MGTHPIFESDFDCLTDMSYGDSASELIKELSRAVDSLPNYDDVAVREVVEECINLEAKNREAYNSEELSRLIAGAEDQTSILDEATNESDITVYVNCAVRKSAIDRNKRCLIAYHMRRLEMIKKMRFELGPVIPAHIRNGLSTRERKFFNEYNKGLSRLMRSYGGIDITQNLTPPKSLYAEVICIEDAGDLELESCERIVLEQNMRYFLPRSAIEHLVRQGLLKEIEKQV